jgi:hypothetical protein
MNKNNETILLGRIDRAREFLDALRQAIESGADRDIRRTSGALVRQMKLLLDEVDAAEDGC